MLYLKSWNLLCDTEAIYFYSLNETNSIQAVHAVTEVLRK